jgi:hypothetical protein
MKKTATVLALLALLALVPWTPCLAQTPQTPQAQPAPNVAAFLASLPGSVSSNLPPAPQFLSTLCNTSADCPSGQLCCYPCGIDGCHNVCMKVTRCPHFP